VYGVRIKITHTYPQPHDYYLPEFIDLAPLEAAYRGLCVLFELLLDQGRQWETLWRDPQTSLKPRADYKP